MDVFRICKKEHADDLTGIGAKLYGGRWNSKGTAILYTAGSRSLAALEVLVHVPATIQMQNFVLITLELPNDSLEEIGFGQIKKEWEAKGMDSNFSIYGDSWARRNKSLILKVPSIVVPEEFNFLLNPNHTLFSKIRVKEKKHFSFDKRLLNK